MPRSPYKLTQAVTTDVVRLVQAGVHPWVAAQRCGVAPRTYSDWMSRGKTARPGSLHWEFRNQVKVAKAQAEASFVARIHRAAANGSWPAAAWLLERQFPQRWAKPSERPALDADEPDPFAALDAADGIPARVLRLTDKSRNGKKTR